MAERLLKVRAFANVEGEVGIAVDGPTLRLTIYLSPDEADALMAGLVDAIERAKAFRRPTEGGVPRG